METEQESGFMGIKVYCVDDHQLGTARTKPHRVRHLVKHFLPTLAIRTPRPLFARLLMR
jgi:hypothetical protein